MSSPRDCGRSGEKGAARHAGRELASHHQHCSQRHIPTGATSPSAPFICPSTRTEKGGSGAAAFHVLLSAFLTLCLFLFHLFSLFFQKRKSSSSVQLMVSVLRLPKCRYCWASPHVPASPVFGSYLGVGKKGQRGWREHPQSRITHKPH